MDITQSEDPVFMEKVNKVQNLPWIVLFLFACLLGQSCNSQTGWTEERGGSRIAGPLSPGSASVTGTSAIDIQSAANMNFPDPFPVRPWLLTDDYKYFYSTSGKIMYCHGPVSANSFAKISPISIDDGILQQYIDNNGVSVPGYWAKNVYRDNLNNWHMVASPRIKRNGQSWNIIVHLKPQDGEVWGEGTPIKKWIVNKVLVGDPLTPHLANYAGKYYKGPDGVLYLVYVKRIPNTFENAIYAQRMRSTIEVNQDYNPVKLVAPGAYNSEYRNGTSGLKLLETGNMMRISGKFIIAYTVGDYADDNYKIGLAWSDNLLGPYKKVLKKDNNNIWGNGAGAPEVQYLLQAQKSSWPNYVKARVKGPGVPSLNRDSNGKWYVFFAGYPASATKTNGKYNASERHPYYVQLNMNIPAKSVSEASSYELQNWITCMTE